VKRARAAGTCGALDLDRRLDPRQVSGQGTPVRPPLGLTSDLLGGVCCFRIGVPCRFGLLGLLEPEKELILGQALGPAAEAVALHGLDDLAQSLVLGTLLFEQRLEGAGIIGQGRSRGAHEPIRSCSSGAYYHFEGLRRAFLLSSARLGL
jgi:hypothetical protein